MISPLAIRTATSNRLVASFSSAAALYGRGRFELAAAGTTVARTDDAFTLTAPATGFAVGTATTNLHQQFFVALGDVNGDSKPDAVLAYSPDGADGGVAIMLGRGDGGFGAPQYVYTAYTPNPMVGLADLDQSGSLDVFTLDGNSNSADVLLNDGSGGFPTTQSQKFPVSLGPVSAAAGDFTADGIPDVVVASNNGGQVVTVLKGTGGGSFTPLGPETLSGSPTWVSAGDMNGDGAADLVISELNPPRIEILYAPFSTSGSPAATNLFTAQHAALMAIPADVNGDGNLDVVTAETGTGGSVGIYLSGGSGAPVSTASFSTGAPQASGVAVVDLNGDGIPDVAVVSGSFTGDSRVAVLSGFGDGGFRDGGIYQAVGTGSNGVAYADLNGDGKLDLVVTTFIGPNNGTSPNAITVLLGR